MAWTTTPTFLPELRRVRRLLHRFPEIGLHLPRTQQTVLESLEGLPLEISTGSSCSSVTAVLRGGDRDARQPRAVLLRGDMDALPVTEATALEYASEIPGAMHACGHDLHTAMLIGAARTLSEHRSSLAGDVVFMFQPGEEGLDGAGHMLREGVLDASGTRVEAAYGLHVMSSGLPFGAFATRRGTIMASADGIAVTVTGAGGHGSAPHLGNDPVVVAAEMATAAQVAVTRRINVLDPAVVTIGSFHAGTQRNIIPETATFEATIRCFAPETRSTVQQVLTTLFEGIAHAHGVQAQVTYLPEYPPTVNTAVEADGALDLAAELFGPERSIRLRDPYTASEDFSRVLENVPGAFIALGATRQGLDPMSAPFNHSAHAVFDDAVLEDGALFLASLAHRRLSTATHH